MGRQVSSFQTLNMEVSGAFIKRRNGIPQCSELALGLFSIYTTYILEHLDISEDAEIAMFADNLVMIPKTLTKDLFKQEILKINDQFCLQ